MSPQHGRPNRIQSKQTHPLSIITNPWHKKLHCPSYHSYLSAFVFRAWWPLNFPYISESSDFYLTLCVLYLSHSTSSILFSFIVISLNSKHVLFDFVYNSLSRKCVYSAGYNISCNNVNKLKVKSILMFTRLCLFYIFFFTITITFSCLPRIYQIMYTNAIT